MFDFLGPPEWWWWQFKSGFGPDAGFVIDYHQTDPYWPMVLVGAYSWLALPYLFAVVILWFVVRSTSKETKICGYGSDS